MDEFDVDEGSVEENEGLWGEEIKPDMEEEKDKQKVVIEVGSSEGVAPGWKAAFEAAGFRPSFQ